MTFLLDQADQAGIIHAVSNICLQASQNQTMVVAFADFSSEDTDWSGHVQMGCNCHQLPLFKMDLWKFRLEISATQHP